jgi:hypothetical protein
MKSLEASHGISAFAVVLTPTPGANQYIGTASHGPLELLEDYVVHHKHPDGSCTLEVIAGVATGQHYGGLAVDKRGALAKLLGQGANPAASMVPLLSGCTQTRARRSMAQRPVPSPARPRPTRSSSGGRTSLRSTTWGCRPQTSARWFRFGWARGSVSEADAF